MENAFSLRRMDPFNGTLQVFTTPTARALSSNGVTWDLQVLSETPQGLWANTPFGGRQFYSFGLWSQQQGLRQVPLHPLFNARGMLESAQELMAELAPCLDRLPFPQVDDHELWLLDEETGAPIALLNTARDPEELAGKDVRRWIAASRGDFSFVSDYLRQLGVPTNDGFNPRVHASVLEAQVRDRSGQNHRRAWFLRNSDGSASVVDEGQPALPVEAFPVLPLTLEWTDAEEQALAMDYIGWKAPQLLLLPGLPGETRGWLEELAVKDAAQIERFWRLYPEIHNKPLLNAARIEARIRSANQM